MHNALSARFEKINFAQGVLKRLACAKIIPCMNAHTATNDELVTMLISTKFESVRTAPFFFLNQYECFLDK